MDCIAEQLIELQSRQMRRDKFKTASLTEFWANILSMEPNLSDHCQQATIALLPFPTTYLCETFRHWLWLKLRTAANYNRKMVSDVH